MGQKVNPHGARVGVIKDWSTRWYADKKNFADNLVSDAKLRKMIKELEFVDDKSKKPVKLYDAGISSIDIERRFDNDKVRVTVTLNVAKPGIVIGTNGANIAKIKAAIEASKTAYLQKHSGKKLRSALKTTLHDGDGERPNGGEFGPECKGHYVMTCSSNNKPVIVYADKTPITEASELYSGCYGRAIVNFYVYDTNGNKGVSAGLNGIMKLSDGEPLSGGVVTDSDWDDDFEDEDDELLS